MKKYLIILGLTFSVPTLAFASFTSSLSYGSSGTDVMQLQQFLVSQNCLSTTPTGYFGALTVAAVKCFQSKYDIPSTGFFGSLSRAEANAVSGISVNSSAIKTSTSAASSCPSGWTCLPGPAQGVLSPANLSQGVLAPAPVSPLAGSGSTTVIVPAANIYTLSPLVGSGSTTLNTSQYIGPTANLSPLVGAGSTTFIQ